MTFDRDTGLRVTLACTDGDFPLYVGPARVMQARDGTYYVLDQEEEPIDWNALAQEADDFYKNERTRKEATR